MRSDSGSFYSKLFENITLCDTLPVDFKPVNFENFQLIKTTKKLIAVKIRTYHGFFRPD